VDVLTHLNFVNFEQNKKLT